MTLPRLLVDLIPNERGSILLPETQANHLRALRVRVGDDVVLTDGCGAQYAARVARQTRDCTELTVLALPLEVRESAFQLTLAVALLKGEKLDWVIEKGTEIGVARFILVDCANSIGAASPNKLTRWQRIAAAAVEQSQRSRLPRIDGPVSLAELATVSPRPILSLVLSEGSQEADLGCILPDRATEGWALTGPEGGFTASELALLERNQWRRVRLGPRILRAETAALTIAATLQFHLGDLRARP